MGGAQLLGLHQVIVGAVVATACLPSINSLVRVSSRGSSPGEILRGCDHAAACGLPACRFCKQRCADGNRCQPGSNHFLTVTQFDCGGHRDGIGASNRTILNGKRTGKCRNVACARRPGFDPPSLVRGRSTRYPFLRKAGAKRAIGTARISPEQIQAAAGLLFCFRRRWLNAPAQSSSERFSSCRLFAGFPGEPPPGRQRLAPFSESTGLPAGSFLRAFCSIISMSAFVYWSYIFSGSQSAAICSISVLAISSSFGETSFSEADFSVSGSSTSWAKCMSSRMRKSPSGLTAANTLAVESRPFAMPDFARFDECLVEQGVGFSLPLFEARESRAVEEFRIDLGLLDKVGNFDGMG